MQNVLLGASPHSSGRKSLLLNAMWDVMSGTSAAILLQQDKAGPQRMQTEEIQERRVGGVCIQSTLKSAELLDFQ